jgi:integrase
MQSQPEAGTKGGTETGTKREDAGRGVALTDVKIRNAPIKARRYRIADSHGLSIEIAPKGKRLGAKEKPRKFWRYRYRLNGRENLFAGGEWCQAPTGETPEEAVARRDAGRLTLAEARGARVAWRDMVRRGQHPRLVRATGRLLAAQSAAMTFRAVAEEFVEKRGGHWGASYRRHVVRFLEGDCYPDLGDLPIANLETAHLLPILNAVADRDALSVAHSGRSILGQLWRFAISTRKAVTDPTAALRGALAKMQTKHHPPLARDQIGPFLQAVAKAGANRSTEIAIRLLLLTMLRTVELRTASWTEIDMARAELRLGPEKMKGRKPHIVPLAPQAMELIKELHRITGNRSRLFPNVRRPSDAMAGSTIGRVFSRAGYARQFSPHGFRATAATILREEGCDDRAIELQLSHSDRNKSRRSYDHSEKLELRRAMLEQWADLINRLSIPAVGASPKAKG